MPTALSLSDLSRRLGHTPTTAGAVLARVGPTLAVLAAAGVKEHFATATAPDGTPWPALRRPRPAGGDKPLRSTGLLMASVSARMEGDELALSANGPGAALHNFGGVVRPVEAKVLTIPLTREAARVSSPRLFPRPLFAARGGLYEAVGKGKARRLVRQYAFSRAVTIPKREYLGFSAKTVGRMAGVIGAALGQQAAKAIGGPS